MSNELFDIKNCPACGSDNLVYVTSREQIVCKDCGLVHEPFSAVSKEVLEITHPAEATIETARERVAIKAPRKQPLKKIMVKKAKPKVGARKAMRLIKKPKAKKAMVKKIIKRLKVKHKAKARKRPLKAVAAQKPIERPIIQPPRPQRAGIRARLKRLIRR